MLRNDLDTNVEILNLLLEQKQRAPNKYEKEVIGVTTLEWMLENVRLDVRLILFLYKVDVLDRLSIFR